jgi:hypothetical protein
MKATAKGQLTVARKPECKAVSPRTETACKADGPGKAARLRQWAFLRFRMYQGKLRWTDAAVRTLKQRARERTDRHNGRSMRSRLLTLRRYVTGWLHDFGHSRSYAQLIERDPWLRCRMRP